MTGTDTDTRGHTGDGTGNDEAILQRRTSRLASAGTLAELPLEKTLTSHAYHRDESPPSSAPDLALPQISVDAGDATTAAPDAPAAEFAIVSTIGEGGMGRVHLARQRSLDRDVALKTIRRQATPAVAKALLREGRLTGALEHPGVIPIHALGLDHRGRPMLVMKRVDGADLTTLLADPAHPGWRARGKEEDRLTASLEILSQVCRTIEFAHSRGVFHRDIKPDNIMVGAFGEVYLLDWGIATTADAVDDPTLMLGTPVYMAPEMVRAARVDARTDVYLLGATLHTIVTGQRRHEGTNAMAVFHAALRSAPVEYEPHVPGELARLCNRATAAEPDDRPQTAQSFREEIADFLRHRSARALSDAALERLVALEKLLASAPDGALPSDLAYAYRLATEARFGLTQALREDAEGATAREGMRRCIAASVELELRQKHPDTADRMLADMDPPDPVLVQRIATLRERAAIDARERERLATIERDLDPSAHSSKRSLSLVLYGLILFPACALVGLRASTSSRALAFGGVLGTSLAAVVFLLLRRRIFTNAFNLRIGYGLMVALVASLVNRVLGVITDSPTSVIVRADLVIFAAVMSAVAVMIPMPGLWACTAIYVLGIVATCIRPDDTNVIFAADVSATLLVSAWLLARMRPAGKDV